MPYKHKLTQATDATKGLGAYQPFLNKASTAADAATGLTGTGAGTGAGSIASYMSPYQSDVIDTALTEFDRQAAAQKASQSAQALGIPGAFGGGREGVLQAEYASNSDRNRAALQANFYNKVFNKRNKQDNKILLINKQYLINKQHLVVAYKI